MAKHYKNAVTHSFYSSEVVLSDENQAEYESCSEPN